MSWLINRRKHLAHVALAGAAVLVVSLACPVRAFGDIVYDVTYNPTSGFGCTISCFDFPPSLLTPFSATFTLPTADLSTPGTYDVSPSYTFPFVQGTPLPVAEAVVAGGEVTDLTVAYNGQFSFGGILGTVTVNQSFTESGGSFQENTSSSLDVSSQLNGSYSIAAVVPEPGTWLLLAGGVVLCAWLMRKSHRTRFESLPMP